MIAQSMAREYGPFGIHVAHVVIDGGINGDRLRNRVPTLIKERGEDGLLGIDAIAKPFKLTAPARRGRSGGAATICQRLTRNYVERVMENLAVYRGRFGDSTAAIEPNLHRAVSIECHSNPTAVEQRPAPIEADLSSPN